jgi:hypothetical protein
MALCFSAALLVAEDAPADSDYESDIRPLLAQYCFRCHGEEQQKGDVRLDVLDPDFVNGANAEGWHFALDMLNSGDMPPKREAQPTEEERRLIVTWMTEGVAAAAAAHKGKSTVVLRRLNKSQYTNTLQDLLGLPINFGQDLPDDGKSEMGFTNNGGVLQSSPLHIDYYQVIAREALEQAIVIGDKPEVTHYRVTLGKGSGKGLVASQTGGYQSVPLSTDDFRVDILDANGQPQVGADKAAQDEFDSIKRRITVGLRGSAQNRFRVVDAGMTLYSAKPHKEVPAGSWQGPSPNVKLEMQRCFPETGDFALRVRASRGELFLSGEEMLIAMEAPVAHVSIRGAAGGVSADAGSILLVAHESKERKNLVSRDAYLVPEAVTEPSSAQFEIEAPAAGYYQVDMVHPLVQPDAMPSVRLSLGGLTLDLRPTPTEDQLKEPRIVTTLGAAYLRKKKHTLKVGGPFFTGFSHLVLTPLPADHELMDQVDALTDERTAELRDMIPSLRPFVGTRTDDGMDYATFDQPQEVHALLGQAEDYTFIGRLENLPIPEPDTGDLEILSGFLLVGFWNDHLVKSNRETGPPLLVEEVEFEAPYIPEWPPAAHTAIFFDSPDRADEEVYTGQLITRFIERAFRRPLAADEVERYMEFWRGLRGDYEHYEESIREVLVAALCSPNFLYMVEADAEAAAPPQYELATRLSYFLWNSPPDEALTRAASGGQLQDELLTHVDRMLDDPRSKRFVRSFGEEWLRLDRHEGMTVNPNKYPAFTRFVKRDMAEETHQFLYRVVHEDLSIFTLIDSDFAMLNQNLAEFYGIDNVAGGHFRPVAIQPEERRGGLLSQGAFLSGHSDGNEPHPIKRAVWLKEKILGDAPPPPPPNVPDLDPDAPGFENLTLKQQLEKHRDNASCHDCHLSIDPYGIVFENYDAAGRYVEKRKGEVIDATTTLMDGTNIDGVDGMKAYILEQQPDKYAAALIEYLFAYALGRDVSFADEAELAAILEQVQSGDYRMRAVIRAIVSSPSFTRN